MKFTNFWFLSMIFLFVFLPSVQASGYDWLQYGNDYQPLTQAQYSGITSLFNSTASSVTLSGIGQNQFSFPTQVVIGSLASLSEVNYMVIVDGSYLKVYSSPAYTFVTEVYLPYVSMGQMAITDFDRDGENEIMGWFRVNATTLQLNGYKLNLATNLLDNFYNFTFSQLPNVNITGLRCSPASIGCYGIYWENNGSGNMWYDLQVNYTGYDSHQLLTNRTSYYPLEPPAMVDYDSNGISDFLIFSESKVLVYNQLGTVILDKDMNRGASKDEYLRGAKFFKGDGSPYWKLAITYDIPYQAFSSLTCGTYSCSRIRVINIPDGSSIFDVNFGTSLTSADDVNSLGLAIADYNGDFYDDLWVVSARYTSNLLGSAYIFKGDGTILYQNTTLGTGIGSIYPRNQLTLGKMNNDNLYDFIIYTSGKVKVWDTSSGSYLFNSTISGTQGSCIPADANFDGFLEIVCSTATETKIFYANYLNQNSYINSIVFSPSTSIPKQTTLSATISATDPEGNEILYSHKCQASDNWSVENTNSIKTCYYATVGSYDLSVRVRDYFHAGVYDDYTQTIYVTETGISCGNGICEAGETYSNCPADCSTNQTTTQATETGGMPIPLKIVDTENTDNGFLPQVYYGTLGFLSNTLQPFIILVFTIFFVLIILAVAMIIKNVAKKVGNISR